MDVGDVGLLGPFRVIRNGKPLALGGRRQRAVLAALALSANNSVSKDRLIQLVWGDDAPVSAEAVLLALPCTGAIHKCSPPARANGAGRQRATFAEVDIEVVVKRGRSLP
jgi:hypothetical protein